MAEQMKSPNSYGVKKKLEKFSAVTKVKDNRQCNRCKTNDAKDTLKY